jgi:hypothetical protein
MVKQYHSYRTYTKRKSNQNSDWTFIKTVTGHLSKSKSIPPLCYANREKGEDMIMNNAQARDLKQNMTDQ